MTMIEKIAKYIERANLSNGRYEMNFKEVEALNELLACTGTVYAIAMAYDYGRAKGLCEAKAGARA